MTHFWVTELDEEEAGATFTDEELSQVTEKSWDRVWRNWLKCKKLMLAQSRFTDLLHLFLKCMLEFLGWLMWAQKGVYGGEFAKLEACDLSSLETGRAWHLDQQQRLRINPMYEQTTLYQTSDQEIVCGEDPGCVCVYHAVWSLNYSTLQECCHGPSS